MRPPPTQQLFMHEAHSTPTSTAHGSTRLQTYGVLRPCIHYVVHQHARRPLLSYAAMLGPARAAATSSTTRGRQRRKKGKARKAQIKRQTEWAQHEQRLDDQKRKADALEDHILARQLSLSNISYQATAADVRNWFEQRFKCKVVLVRISYEKKASSSLQSKGYGFIELEEEEHARSIKQAANCGSEPASRGTLRACTVVNPKNPALSVSARPKPWGRQHHQTGQWREFDALSLDVGCMVNNTELRSELTLSSSSAKLIIDLPRRCLDIRFMHGSTVYRLTFRFKHLLGHLQLAGDGCSLLLCTSLPPEVYMLQEDVTNMMPFQRTALSRTSSMPMPHNLQHHMSPSEYSQYYWPEKLAKAGAVDDAAWERTTGADLGPALGTCFAYCITLTEGAAASFDGKLMRKLHDFHILPRHLTETAWARIIEKRNLSCAPPLVQITAATPSSIAEAGEKLNSRLLQLAHSSGRFILAWRVRILLAEGVVHKWGLLQDGPFWQLLNTVPVHAASQALAALGGGSTVLPHPSTELEGLLQDFTEGATTTDSPSFAPQMPQHTMHSSRADVRLFNGGSATKSTTFSSGVPDHCMEVLRVQLSPLRTSCIAPDVEMSNRVVRDFCKHHGFESHDFLRVSCTEEDGRALFSSEPGVSKIFGHFQEMLLAGLNILGRHYRFLAYSSSQLKECSLWMVCTDKRYMMSGELWTPDAMRRWMGDFMQTIRVPAKCAARMGQCFSTTTHAAAVALPDMIEIPDIERNGYCFTDGVGQISKDLLVEAIEQMPNNKRHRGNVSAIQVRLAGMKGVLALEPGLVGKQVRFRPSMRKFSSDHTALEIITVATRIPCYLNRSVITLLVSNGLQPEVILHMQRNMVRQLDRMMTDPATAVALLPTLSGVETETSNLLQNMLIAGCSPDDVFMASCLAAIRNHHVMMLQKKARILVKEGCQLLGTVDEHGVLEPEEVFVQIRDASGTWKVLECPVLVAKHPVTHPGDVRKLMAVDKPCLRHKKHELVFSQKGDRPVPNQLSGSDLDGDQYAIIWNTSLFPPGPNKQPMDYTAPKPVENFSEVTERDLLQHFTDFQRNNNLGRIANASLAHADLHAHMRGQGVEAAGIWECLRLAELHSIAVDFPKTGVPAELPRELVPEQVPTWLNERKKPYISTSVLGQLYKEAQEQRFVDPVAEASDSHRLAPSHADLILKQHGYRAYQGLMRELQKDYERDMSAIMNKFHLRSEGELLTGCLLKYHRLMNRRQHETAEQVRLMASTVRRLYRTRFKAAVCGGLWDNSDSSLSDHEKLELLNADPVAWERAKCAASACYLAAYGAPSQTITSAAVANPGVPLYLVGVSSTENYALQVLGLDDNSNDSDSSEEEEADTTVAALPEAAERGKDVRDRHMRSFPWAVAGDVLCRVMRKSLADTSMQLVEPV